MISELPGVSLERVKESEESVADYSRRPRKKHRQEMALVARMMPDIATGGRVLDAPCGAGRLSVWMGRKGWRVSALDRGKAAVAHTRDAVAREGLEAEVLEGDIFRMPWRDRFFTAVVCFRLLHHFEDIVARRALLAELARVSDQHLLVSYLSPFSFSGFKRWIKWRLTGRRHRQNHTPLSELIWIMAAQGFVLVSDERQRGLWRALHLAHFKRVPVR